MISSTQNASLTYNEMCPYKYKAVIICTQIVTQVTLALNLPAAAVAHAVEHFLPDAQGKYNGVTFQDLLKFL